MTKAEAAKLLGVSFKTIERYNAKGRLHPHYKRGRNGGREVIFNKDEVLALKQEMEQPKIARAATAQSDQIANDIPMRHGASDAAIALSMQFSQLLSQQFERMTALLENKPAKSQDDLYMLSLVEAATITGLPESFLRSAIEKGKKRLKAILVAENDWRIRRKDLKRFIDKLI